MSPIPSVMNVCRFSPLDDFGGGGEPPEGAPGGDFGEFAAAAVVSTSIFIPWPQCPAVPQMKYRFPGVDNDITVSPPVCVSIGLLVPHES